MSSNYLSTCTRRYVEVLSKLNPTTKIVDYIDYELLGYNIYHVVHTTEIPEFLLFLDEAINQYKILDPGSQLSEEALDNLERKYLLTITTFIQSYIYDKDLLDTRLQQLQTLISKHFNPDKTPRVLEIDIPILNNLMDYKKKTDTLYSNGVLLDSYIHENESPTLDYNKILEHSRYKELKRDREYLQSLDFTKFIFEEPNNSEFKDLLVKLLENCLIGDNPQGEISSGTSSEIPSETSYGFLKGTINPKFLDVPLWLQYIEDYGYSTHIDLILKYIETYYKNLMTPNLRSYIYSKEKYQTSMLDKLDLKDNPRVAEDPSKGLLTPLEDNHTFNIIVAIQFQLIPDDYISELNELLQKLFSDINSIAQNNQGYLNSEFPQINCNLEEVSMLPDEIEPTEDNIPRVTINESDIIINKGNFDDLNASIIGEDLYDLIIDLTNAEDTLENYLEKGNPWAYNPKDPMKHTPCVRALDYLDAQHLLKYLSCVHEYTNRLHLSDPDDYSGGSNPPHGSYLSDPEEIQSITEEIKNELESVIIEIGNIQNNIEPVTIVIGSLPNHIEAIHSAIDKNHKAHIEFIDYNSLLLDRVVHKYTLLDRVLNRIIDIFDKMIEFFNKISEALHKISEWLNSFSIDITGLQAFFDRIQSFLDKFYNFICKLKSNSCYNSKILSKFNELMGSINNAISSAKGLVKQLNSIKDSITELVDEGLDKANSLINSVVKGNGSSLISQGKQLIQSQLDDVNSLIFDTVGINIMGALNGDSIDSIINPTTIRSLISDQLIKAFGASNSSINEVLGLLGIVKTCNSVNSGRSFDFNFDFKLPSFDFKFPSIKKKC